MLPPAAPALPPNRLPPACCGCCAPGAVFAIPPNNDPGWLAWLFDWPKRLPTVEGCCAFDTP